MTKRIQNIIFFLMGFIFLAVAIYPLVYFIVIFSVKSNSSVYSYFRNNTFYNLIFFTFIFFFFSLIFIIPGTGLFQREKVKKLFSFKRTFYILMYVSLIEVLIMIILFPEPINIYRIAPPLN